MPTLFAELPRPPRRVAEGIAHLPGFLSLSAQAQLVGQARDIARSVAGTPVAMTRPYVGTGQMSAYILSLGQHWRTRPYGYVTEVDGVAVPALPEEFARCARQALAQASEVAPELQPWVGEYRPEAALVNYYPPAASMGLHVDRNEESNAPIVSLSVGDEAVFRIAGTESAAGPFIDVTLMSGDAIVFGGSARRVFHGITRLNDNTGPAGTGVKEGRINVTIRQIRG